MQNFNITSAEFQKLSKKGNTVILDVRTDVEYSENRIPNSTQIDFYQNNFPDEISRLEKSMTYLVYCRSGSRSFQTCMLMKQLGFEKVFNLQDGILNWDGEVESN